MDVKILPSFFVFGLFIGIITISNANADCRAIHSYCYQHSDCCSNFCIPMGFSKINTCVHLPKKATPKHNPMSRCHNIGDTCYFHNNCCSGFCDKYSIFSDGSCKKN